jgi:hypothetical protein
LGRRTGPAREATIVPKMIMEIAISKCLEGGVGEESAKKRGS